MNCPMEDNNISCEECEFKNKQDCPDFILEKISWFDLSENDYLFED
jgi:hypothetical protein